MVEIAAPPHARSVRATLRRRLRRQPRASRRRRVPGRRRPGVRERRLLPGRLGLGGARAALVRGDRPGARRGVRGRAAGPTVSRCAGRSRRLDLPLVALDEQRAEDGARERADARLPRLRHRRGAPAPSKRCACAAHRPLVRGRHRLHVRARHTALPGPTGRVRPDRELPPLRARRLLERPRPARGDGHVARARAGRPRRPGHPLSRRRIDRRPLAHPLLHLQPGSLDRVLRRARRGDRARPAPAPARDDGARAHSLGGDRDLGRLDVAGLDPSGIQAGGSHPRRPRPGGDRDRHGRRSRARDSRSRLGRGRRLRPPHAPAVLLGHAPLHPGGVADRRLRPVRVPADPRPEGLPRVQHGLRRRTPA